MIRIRDIKLPVGHTDGDLIDEIAKILCLDMIYPGNSYPDFSYEILRRSIDARRKPDIFFVYTVKLLIAPEGENHIIKFFDDHARSSRIRKMRDRILTDTPEQFVIPECGDKVLSKPPVVVGFGPCGMFASLLLARRGFTPIVIERGSNVDERTKIVEGFWEKGRLDPESNVQFGEGGAGTFSDGKLNTLTKDTNGRNTYVLKTFAEHGAPSDILIDAKPHIGTDVLKTVVRNIREEIISLGGKVLFDTKLTDIKTDGGKISSITVSGTKSGTSETIETDIVIICPGHSARDTFEMLYDRGITMSPKSFAAGFRVVHPQSLVNEWQYGMPDPEKAGLPPADYKVANETDGGRRVYSFCMCPGGYVVNASSEEGRTCVNGMSESGRDGAYANSAIIAAVDPGDFSQSVVPSVHPLAGMYYQRSLEEEAGRRGKGAIPVQRFADYEEDIDPEGVIDTKDYAKGRAIPANLRGIFSEDIDKAIIESMHKFGYTRKGFDADDTVLLGVEPRTSSPVRIERGDSFESNIKGIYPCGEGAGYAGGIMSAASDGIKVASHIIENYRLG